MITTSQDTIRALRLFGRRDLRRVDTPVPTASGSEVLVDVTSVGICGSDLHWFEDGGIGDATLDAPLVLGHEFAGVIASGPDTGVRVAVDPAITCGVCRYCSEGNSNLCAEIQFAGHAGIDGGLRERISWPARLLHPLPASFSDDDGAMLEPLGVAIHATDLGKVGPGDRVGVFGCGPIGLLITQVVRASGGRVVLATDRLDHRLQAASGFGAEHVVNVDEPQSERELKRVADDQNLDVVFEASTTNRAVEDAVAAVRPGGRVILAGIPSGDRTCFGASIARRKALTIKLVRRMKDVYPRAIELASSGSVDLKAIVSHRFSLDQFEDAFETAVRRSGLKVIIYSHTPRG